MIPRPPRQVHEPSTADQSRRSDRYPGVVTVMAYLGRYEWNTVPVDGRVPDEDVYELIDASYADIVGRLPKAKRPS